GKKLGAETFDMWGSLPPTYSESHPWAGFTRFKEGYGTQFTHLSAGFDLVINPILYPIYNLIYSIREKILTTA
ncbi:MAG: peptidoglycan bridge formation glycyltransferase FemA/FemB family protein, partial [Candidatus Roizmanbacteria bacterium]|nr:peptidoglycan bridge formation glycyltransferase FemA/FemB family protein [Candidatus Roizmanbacteria bacterium]